MDFFGMPRRSTGHHAQGRAVGSRFSAESESIDRRSESATSGDKTESTFLYDDYGPYYVGLTRSDLLGSRLKSHCCRDRHRDRWNRFSWFGFRRVLTGRLADGTRTLGKVPERLLTDSKWTIGDIEALLIQALGTPGNAHKERFAQAEQWTQVMRDDVEFYLDRLDRPSPSRARQRETRRRRRIR